MPPAKLVGMLKGMKMNLNYLSPGYLMSMLLPQVKVIVLRKWRKTLHQLLNGVKET
jgi:hypothetical protein